jgi:glycosyltransferase involved in cell wall biosynthesis
MRIGFLDRSDASWTAGASYTRSVVNALAGGLSAGDELCVIAGQSGVCELPAVAKSIRVEGSQPSAKEIEAIVAEHGIDVVLPVTELLTPETACARIGWIPDFQHRRLPQYFSEDQRAQRDAHFELLLRSCDAMMFSSDVVLADFREFYSDFGGESATVHFASSLAWQPGLLVADPTPVIAKYKLPRAFALVVNQFWRHKNHRVVVEAVAQAREQNPDVHIVMVGMLSDSRDITNAHLSEIVRRLSTEKLFANISVLGEVPFEDLLSLLRCAALVIQPSEFEGWSTTVQDAIALGKPLACSDIATHREQAPEAAFFNVDDAAALASHLARREWKNSGWQGNEAEARSLEAECERGRQWGARLAKLAREVVARLREHPQEREKIVPSLEQIKRSPAAYREYLESQVKYLETQTVRLRDVEGQLKTQVQSLQENLEGTWKTAQDFREKYVAAHERAEAAESRYWQERQKPLRQRMCEAVFGRKD